MKSIAFLRSVNVGGHNRINMEELKVALTKVGFKGLTSYIQSGNLLFDSGDVRQIKEVIKQSFGLDIAVIDRSYEQLVEIVANCKYRDDLAYVSLLSSDPDEQLLARVEAVDGKGDGYYVVGNNVYIEANNPYHQTVYANGFWERRLQVTSTTRNIKVLKAILRLSEQ